jgi:uncharacterized membrane protein
MNYLLITLRIVHIVAGIFWVGGALMMTFFISPTTRATEEAGQKFLGHLMNNLKLSQRLASAAGLSLLAGLWLCWIHFRLDEFWRRPRIWNRCSVRHHRIYLRNYAWT